MQTNVVKVSDELKGVSSPGLLLQVRMRETALAKWLETSDLSDRLSGTLKKNARIGMKHNSQLTHEALCQVLGWGFEAMPTTYVTFNDAMTEGDASAITEAGWHIDRLLATHIFPEDEFETKYINIQDEHGNIVRQGVGVIMRQTSIQRVKNGQVVFALLAEYDSHAKKRGPCTNPF